MFDRWTPIEKLIFFNLAQVDMIMDTTLKVKYMVNGKGKLKLDLLQNWFIDELVNCFMVIPRPLSKDGIDKLGWEIIIIKSLRWVNPIIIFFIILIPWKHIRNRIVSESGKAPSDRNFYLTYAS